MIQDSGGLSLPGKTGHILRGLAMRRDKLQKDEACILLIIGKVQQGLPIIIQLLSKLVFSNDLFNRKAPYVWRKVESNMGGNWGQLLG